MNKLILTTLLLFLWAVPVQAQKYTDQQIANAIRKAEGVWTYGIKTIKCETEKECKQICLNTIKNNRIRYAYKHKDGEGYLEFLSKRYCPIGAKNDSKGLNNNWLKNVKYFLVKDN